jgi:lipid II:glycine glycyltransferase (peptidoglycan interpeptide bridge formation enzyme)
VDTTPSSDQLFQRLSKSTRNKIRRSFRRGVTIDSESSSAKIDRAYRLIQFSYERSSVPLVDVDLFHQAFDRLGSGTVKVRVATYNNEDVAGGISLTFGDRMLAWYGGTARVSGITSFDCLTWDEITWCSENGISKYDFGGAGWPDEEYGPREFKAKFGGELVRYGRYQKAFQPLRLKLATSAYRLMQRIKPR